jgi:hypothetical protein
MSAWAAVAAALFAGAILATFGLVFLVVWLVRRHWRQEA